jgi:hypothetical protein
MPEERRAARACVELPLSLGFGIASFMGRSW